MNFFGKHFTKRVHFLKSSSFFFGCFTQFRDINNPNAVEMREDLAAFNNFTAPGVEVHCLFGNNSGDSLERLFLNIQHFYNSSATHV